jgi:hypothetical protein
LKGSEIFGLGTVAERRFGEFQSNGGYDWIGWRLRPDRVDISLAVRVLLGIANVDASSFDRLLVVA